MAAEENLSTITKLLLNGLINEQEFAILKKRNINPSFSQVQNESNFAQSPFQKEIYGTNPNRIKAAGGNLRTVLICFSLSVVTGIWGNYVITKNIYDIDQGFLILVFVLYGVLGIVMFANLAEMVAHLRKCDKPIN